MPESTLGLLFEISADPKAAENALASFGRSIDKYIGAAQGTAAKVGEAFAAAGKDLLYLGTAAVGAVAGAIAVAKHWSDAGTAIYEAAEKTGLSAEKLSGLRVAAMRNNESFETLQVTIARMEKNISVGLTNPASEAGKVLHALFGTTKQLNDLALLPVDAQIAKVTQRIYGLNNIGERNAALTAVMGRGWMQVNSTMGDLGEKGYDPLIAKAKLLNQFFDAEAAARARQFGFELAQMKIEVEALALGLGQKLVPVLSQLIFLAEVKVQQGLGKTLVQATRDAAAGFFNLAATLNLGGMAHENYRQGVAAITLAIAGGSKETQAMTDVLVAQRMEIDKLTRGLNNEGEGHLAVAKAKKEEKTETAEILRLASELGLATATTDAEYRQYLHTLAEINKIHDEQARQALAQMNDERFRQELAKRGIELTKDEIKLHQDMVNSLHLEKVSEDQLTEAERRAAVSVDQLTRRSRELRQEWILQRTQLRLLSSDAYNLYIPAFQAAAATVENFRIVGMNALAEFQRGMAMNIAQAVVYEKSIGAAFREALKQAAASLAAEAILQALKCTALGFYFLAIQSYGQAALAFKSAAIWGAIGVSAALVGRAIPGEKTTGAAAGGYGGAAPYSSAGAGTAAPPREERGPTINVYIDGVISSDNLDEVLQQINERVQGGDMHLISTTTLAPTTSRS